MKQSSVLIVDDDPLNRRILGIFLDRLGYLVTAVHNAEIAIQKLTEGEFELVLMDDLMPSITGLQTLEIMRNSNNPKLKNIPVIMCTANDQPDDRQRYLMAGSNGYITKPVSAQSLKIAIEQIQRDALCS